MSIKSIIKDATNRFGNVYLSEGSLKSAFYKVRRELREMGLLADGSKLDSVKIIRETFTWDGLSTAVLDPRYPERRMVDILRHEFGHALSDKYSRYFSDEEIVKAFGDICGDGEAARDDDERNYVSDYARTNASEDFAETFML